MADPLSHRPEVVVLLGAWALLGAVSPGWAAAGDGPWRLRVVDQSTGQPVTQARAWCPPGDLVWSGQDDGDIILGALPEAGPRCVVRVSAPGYADAELPCVRIADGAREVGLERQPIRLHESVVVAAARDSTPLPLVSRAVSIVDADDLRRVQPRTTPEALFETAGVWVQKTNHGGGSPVVRGLMGNQVLVLVDGVRLNNATFRYGPNQYLATVDPFSLERIEVVRGAGSVLFGSDAIGGVVNVVTHQPELSAGGRHLSGRALVRVVSSGMEQTVRGAFSASGAWAGVNGGVSMRRFGDLRAGGSLGVEAPSGYDEIDGDARALVQLGPRTVLAGSWQLSHQEDVPRYDQVAQRGFARWSFDPQQRQLAWARITQGTTSPWAHTLLVTTSWQRSRERRERQRAGSPVFVVEQDIVDTVGLLLEGRAAPWKPLTVRYGFDLYRDRVGSWREDVDVSTAGRTTRRGLYPDSAQAASSELFAAALWQAGAVTVDCGVRRSWSSIRAEDATFGTLEVEPSATLGSLAASVDLGAGLALYGVVGQAFRAPNIDDVSTLGAFDFGIEVPSPDLVPERSLSLEGGAKLRGRRVEMTGSLWRISLDDLIDRVRSTYQGLTEWEGQRVYRRANVGEAYIRGAEVEAAVAVAPGVRVSGFVAYAYGQQTTAAQPMRRIPPLNGRVAVDWRPPRWTLEAAARFAGRQDRLAPGDRDDHRINPLGTPGWQVVDLRASFALTRALSVVGGVGNLGDEAYRIHGSGVDGYGRHAWISLDVRTP
jgi:outer membrane receptor protein involved in Fe transport